MQTRCQIQTPKGLYKKSHHLGSRVDRASATIQAVSLDGACWAAAVLGCWPTTLLCNTLPCIFKEYENHPWFCFSFYYIIYFFHNIFFHFHHSIWWIISFLIKEQFPPKIYYCYVTLLKSRHEYQNSNHIFQVYIL